MQLPPNYLPDENKFHLAGPPAHFQRGLWFFDPSLVVIPSRMGFYYRLAQRRPPSLKGKVAEDAMKEAADTQMLASYGLIPVTTILATVNWNNPLLFEELRRRAPWRLGGAEKVISDVEADDQKKEIEVAAKNDEMLTDLSKDGWGLYLKKLGLRSHMWVPKTGSTPAPLVPHKQKSSAIRVGSIFLP